MSLTLIHPYIHGGIKTGLVSWWAFDEASGVRDDSHGSIDLTRQLGADLSVSGKHSNALDCNNDAYYNNASISGTDIAGTDSFTLAGWTNFQSLTTTSGDSDFLWIRTDSSIADNNDLDWGLRYRESSERLAWGVWEGTTATTCEWGTQPSTSTWYFVVVYWDAENDEIGISLDNGTFVTASFTGTMNNNSSVLRLGRLSGATPRFLDAYMDEWAYWNRLLTSSEISQLYNSGSGVAYDDL